MEATIPTFQDYPARRSDVKKTPLISVVTTVWNGAKTLRRTIETVRQQGIDLIEYIVIDAGSTDTTIDIILANQDVISYWVSEKDRGISDGFNKGLALSRGKYILILNADDWMSPGQLNYAIETLETTGADFVFGDLLYHNDKKVLYRIRGEVDYAARIAHVMPGLNHPTVVIRRSAYEKFGLFDLTLRYAMDYELLLRMHKGGARGIYDPRIVGHMSLEGTSDRNARAALKEGRDISIRHGYPALPAHLLYLWRAAKSTLRRGLAVLPVTLFVPLRRLFNRNYVPEG
jgi:glycosyltransferase involved in cell wall biosynthesis